MQYIHWVSIFTYALIYYCVESTKRSYDVGETEVPPGATLAAIPALLGFVEMYRFWFN